MTPEQARLLADLETKAAKARAANTAAQLNEARLRDLQRRRLPRVTGPTALAGVVAGAAAVAAVVWVAAWVWVPVVFLGGLVAAGRVARSRRVDVRARTARTVDGYLAWTARQAPIVRFVPPVVLVAAVWWCLAWVLSNLAAFMVAAAIVAAVVWRVDGRRSRPVDTRPVDPIVWDDDTDSLDGDAAAVEAALTGSGQATYRAAVAAGTVDPPERTRTDVGYVLDVPLPPEVLPEQVNVRRLARALGVTDEQVQQVRAEPDGAAYEVLGTAPSDLKVPDCPWLGQRTDLRDPCPYAVDAAGRPMTIPLHKRHLMVVGKTQHGKSWLLRQLVLYAAADPRVQLHLVDPKAVGFFEPLRGRCASYYRGDDDTEILKVLQSVRAEIRSRSAATEPDPDRPDWTPPSIAEVVEQRGPVVLVVDEVSVLFTGTGPTKKQVEEQLRVIARTGAELGVSLIVAAQQPEKSSIPASVTEQTTGRVAFRIDKQASETFLFGRSFPAVRTLPPGHFYAVDGGSAVRGVAYAVDDRQAAEHVESLPEKQAPPSDPRLPFLNAVLDAVGDAAGMGWDDLASAVGVPVDDVKSRLATAGVRVAGSRFKVAPGSSRTAVGVSRQQVVNAVNRLGTAR